MAFVYKDESRFRLGLSPAPGPGKYELRVDSPPRQSAAPFGSTAAKQRSVSQAQLPKDKPGPGSYQLSSGKTKEKAIALSAAQEIRLVQLPKESSAFKSGSRRFSESKDKGATPGPGAYTPAQVKGLKAPARQSKTIIFSAGMNRYRSIPSIPGNKQVFGYDEQGNRLQLNQNPFIQYTGTKGDSVGPGRYQAVPKPARKGTSLWSMSKTEKIVQPRTTKPGPGTYELLAEIPVLKLKPSPGFASKTGRSTLDGSLPQKLSSQASSRPTQLDQEEEEESQYNECTPGPGYYNSHISTFTKASTIVEKQCHFGSKTSRFGGPNKQSLPGPGEYEPPGKRTKGGKAPFNCRSDRFDKAEKVGPDMLTYSKEQMSIQKQALLSVKRGYKGKFGSGAERFKEKIQDYELPGPGDYEAVVSSAGKGPAVPFKSQVQRLPGPKNLDLPGPGAYNIKSKITERLQKIKEVEENELIEPVPFGTKQNRWKEQQQGARQEINVERLIAEQHQEEQRPKKPSSMFVSGTHRLAAAVERTPGPGDYGGEAEWNKRTYNILFTKV